MLKDNSTPLSTLNRRSFLQKAGATGVAVAVGSTMATTVSASPKRGGTLRMGIGSGSTTDTFDPRVWVDTWGLTMGRIVYNQLTSSTDDGKIQPELAESWSQSADGLTWTINLKKGIKFHNGKEFVAEDAVYSLRIHFSKNAKSGAKGLMSNWEKVTKSGKHTIKIHLKSGDQDLPWVLNDYHLQMLPKGFKDWTNPIGTGGYKLEKFKAGVTIKFTRCDNYWKANTCWFDKVLIISLLDSTSRLNALMSGQVDVIDKVPAKNAKLLAKKSNIDLVLSTTGMYYNNPMMVDKKPFTDNNVRLAMKLAVDRQKILDKVLLGYGVLGNDQPISSGDEFYNPNIKQRPYDPEKSKFYLKKAGLSKLKVNLHTSDAAYAGAIDAAIVMKEGMKDANININVIRDPKDGYWSNTWMKKPFTSCYWGRRPTSAMTFANTYLTGAAWNDTSYSNPKFDNLLKTLQSSRNRDIRKQASWDMQEILHSDGGQIVPMLPQAIDAKNSKLMGHNPHPIYEMNDHRLAEKTWFA